MDETKQLNSLENVLQENPRLAKENLDLECLQKYNESHPIFSMSLMLERKVGEDERPIGYKCVYHSNGNRIQLEFDLLTGFWKRNLQELNDEDEQEMFNILFDDLYETRCLTMDEQIQMIIQRLNMFFQQKLQQENEEKYEKNFGLSSSLFAEENSMKLYPNEFIELSSMCSTKKDRIIREDDEGENSCQTLSKEVVDYGLRSLINGSRPKCSGLYPPPVAPRRSRQNSACSTQSSVRYASFFPPPTAPVRRRRVVESILLHIQKKKRPLDKILDVFRPPTETMTIYKLGLEFLRLYDGKFNYRQGHTFVMSFEKKNWSLTIEQIKCVECQAGEKEPRSMLILDYKSQLTHVHV